MSTVTDAAAVVQQTPEADPADLRALRLLLRQSRDFRLALALYNDPVRRDGWIRAFADELGKEGVQVLILDLLDDASKEHGLLERIQALVAEIPAGQRFAIMVVNIEARVDYAPELSRPGEPGTAFLDAVNLQRELFPSACPGALVLWMTELMEQAFIRCAPDLWSWRNHVFDLRTRVTSEVREAGWGDRPFDSHDRRIHPNARLHRLEEELAAYRQASSRQDEMRVLNAIGVARLDAGDAKVARLDFEAALQIAREIKNRRGEGVSLGNLGIATAQLGDVKRAIELFEGQLVIARAIGDRRGESNALGNLGNAYGSKGDHEKAIALLEENLKFARALRDRRAEGVALGNLGAAYADLGKTQKAVSYHRKRLAIAREIGDRRAEGIAYGNLGCAYGSMGDARKAIAHHGKQTAIAREIGDRLGEGNSLWNSAVVYANQSEYKKAVEYGAKALAIFQSIGSPLAAKLVAALAEWRSALHKVLVSD